MNKLIKHINLIYNNHKKTASSTQLQKQADIVFPLFFFGILGSLIPYFLGLAGFRYSLGFTSSKLKKLKKQQEVYNELITNLEKRLKKLQQPDITLDTLLVQSTPQKSLTTDLQEFYEKYFT